MIEIRVKQLKKLLVLAAIAVLAGCGGLQKEADQLLDDKNYQDALTIYERIIEQAPSDSKALMGRRRARLGVIEQRLIDVRLMRLAGQRDSTLESLDDLLSRMSSWSLYPEGAVAFTQKEEMTFASQEVEAEILRNLKDTKPFKAQWTVQRWAKLFPSDRLEALGALRKKVSEDALEACERRLGNTDKNAAPFYTRFMLKSCGVFKVQERPRPRAKEQFAWLEPRFKWAKVLTEPEYETQLKQLLQASFRNSPWYDESAEVVLFASAEPKYDFKEEKKDVQLTHAYLEKVPFQALELVEVVTWVPDDRTVTIVGLDGKARSEVVRDTKRVIKSEMQKITRYRDEVRHIPYQAVQYDLLGELSLDLRMNGGSFDQAKKTYFQRETKFYVQHGSDSPDVGLKPSNPQIPSGREVYSEVAQRLSGDFENELRQIWRKEFCNPPTSGEWLEVAEKIQRCLHGSAETPPEFTEKWMRREMGITYSQWQSLIGVL